MGINGINNVQNVQNYNYNNTIPKPEQTAQASKTVIAEVPEQESRVQTSQAIAAKDIQPAEQSAKVSSNAPLDDISITFHKQDDFGYIGRDSDIHSLDVEKALSDMRKDQILQQYQYFVGSKTTFVE